MREWLTSERFCWLDMFGYGLFVGFGIQDRWSLAFASLLAGIVLPPLLRPTRRNPHDRR